MAISIPLTKILSVRVSKNLELTILNAFFFLEIHYEIIFIPIGFVVKMILMSLN